MFTVYIDRVHDALQLHPRRYDHHTFGGPKTADIDVGGSPNALWASLNWLGEAIEIRNDHNTAVWWGYIDEIELSLDGMNIGLSFADMYNSVAVTYTYRDPGDSASEERTTVYAEDTDSIGRYGTKSACYSIGDASDAQAQQVRDNLLIAHADPIPQPELAGPGGSRAVLRCRGYWNLLGWIYYSQVGTVDTATDVQIDDLLDDYIATNGLFSGIDIRATSGISSNQYRNGTKTHLAELEEMLTAGTTNAVRYRARVTPEGRIVIDEEPGSTEVLYFRRSDGAIVTQNGSAIDTGQSIAGYWVGLINQGTLPDYALNLSPLFVERCEYDIDNGQYTLEAKGVTSPWSVVSGGGSGVGGAGSGTPSVGEGVDVVTGTWTATGADAIEWSGVTLRLNDDTTEAMNAGSLGSIAARTFLYYDGTTTIANTTDLATLEENDYVLAVVDPGDVAAKINLVHGPATWPEGIGDLSDVTITTPATDDVLRYNGSGWENTDTVSLDTLTVVNTATVGELVTDVISYTGDMAINLDAASQSKTLTIENTAAAGTVVLDVVGDVTVSGQITVGGDPSAALEVATKQYVDATLTLAGLTDTNISSVTDLDLIQYDSGTSKWVNVQNVTMGGTLTLAGDPVANLEAATKQYVDNTTGTPNALASLSDVTLTSLTDRDLLQYDSGTGKWVNRATVENFGVDSQIGIYYSGSAMGALGGVDGGTYHAVVLEASNGTELADVLLYATGSSAYIALADSGGLGTFAGVRIGTDAEPDEMLHVDGDGKFTGQITVGGDPTAALEVATKQYVDATTGSPSTLGGLSDVTLTSVVNKQFIQYDSGSGQWVNRTKVDDFSVDGQIIVYDGSTTGVLYAYDGTTYTMMGIEALRGDQVPALMLYATGSNGYAVLTKDNALTVFSGLRIGTDAEPDEMLHVDGNGKFTGQITVGDDPSSAYEVATKQYVDTVAGAGSGSTLAGLSDVVLSTPAQYQLLRFSGSYWVNADIGTYTTGAPVPTGYLEVPLSNGTTVRLPAYDTSAGAAKPDKATLPSPSNGATSVSVTTGLGWSNGGNSTSYSVYLAKGTSNIQPQHFLGTTGSTNWTPASLLYEADYYWRVDSTNQNGTTMGDVWHFTTEADGGTPPAPLLTPGKLCIYYGYPSSVNYTDNQWDLDECAADFAAFDVIVLGAGLEETSHDDHSNTISIITKIKALNADALIFGYVDLGVTTNNYSIVVMKSKVSKWLAMGVDGIFFDDAGNDFGVSASRRQTMNDWVHVSGLKVFWNAWAPADIFGDPLLNIETDDIYLMESFLIGNGEWRPVSEWAGRYDYVYDNASCEVAAIGTGPKGASDWTVNTHPWQSVFWGSVMHVFNYAGYTDYYHSAQDTILVSLPVPAASFGSSFAGLITAANNNTVHTRETDEGVITVEGDGTYGKAFFTRGAGAQSGTEGYF